MAYNFVNSLKLLVKHIAYSSQSDGINTDLYKGVDLAFLREVKYAYSSDYILLVTVSVFG